MSIHYKYLVAKPEDAPITPHFAILVFKTVSLPDSRDGYEERVLAEYYAVPTRSEWELCLAELHTDTSSPKPKFVGLMVSGKAALSVQVNIAAPMDATLG